MKRKEDLAKRVTNDIQVGKDRHHKIGKNNIKKTLADTWALSNLQIKVTVSGTTVTLGGVVHSVYQKALATNIAKRASGVLSVTNEIIVDYAYKLVENGTIVNASTEII